MCKDCGLILGYSKSALILGFILAFFSNSALTQNSPYYDGMADYENALLRVKDLRKRVEPKIKKEFEQKGYDYPPEMVYLRAFKQEKILELWVLVANEASFVLFKEYPICKISGDLGPKTKKGDRQAPEGFYGINIFNGASPENHLGLRVSYPNRLDHIRGDSLSKSGGAIYIHGGCNSVGCLAIGNEPIEEVYLLSLEAVLNYQTPVPCHIFPARLQSERYLALQKKYPQWASFWRPFKSAFDYFETHRKLPPIKINTTAKVYEIVP